MAFIEEFSVDFTGLVNISPYVNADFTWLIDQFQILNGGLRPATVSDFSQYLYTGEAVDASKNIIAARVVLGDGE